MGMATGISNIINKQMKTVLYKVLLMLGSAHETEVNVR